MLHNPSIKLSAAARAESPNRRLPIGAEPTTRGTHFRVWAPQCRQVAVVLEKSNSAPTRLVTMGDGYFAGLVEHAKAGALYRFQLDGDDRLVPDPASRFQPDGPRGPSEVVDPTTFSWQDRDWPGIQSAGQVIYEMHVGTFTPSGTWAAALEQLPALADLGITLIELLPVADFEGSFGWGYDGVDFFAPTRLYGRPDDFRRFVDAAHRLGLGVILDVVYNHFGPGGDYLKRFATAYCSSRHKTDWGPALNFDDVDAQPVREFVLANAAYWLQEFHLDGFRVDATQDIHDESAQHILTDFCRHARNAAGPRSIYLVAENEPQDSRLVRRIDEGGHGFDALWNDDFHHSAMVALTGRNEAYYSDYLGTPQEFISAAKWGYLYQGQRCAWQKQRRGRAALDLPASTFVTFLQNHDQAANSARGLRLHELSSPGCYRAMTAMLLLGPGTPMLLQGQEFCTSSPFLYFADHPGDLGELVRKGRLDFLAQFPSLKDKAVSAGVPVPNQRTTFERCKLNPQERSAKTAALALHRDLLRLRRDPTIQAGDVDGAVIGPDAFVLRFFGEAGHDRLLVVNFGRDVHFVPAPEPLLAPPNEGVWQLLLSTEQPEYGGCGHGPVETEEEGWHLPGHAAVVLAGRPAPAQLIGP